MQMNLFTRRFAAWAAFLAILMSALAPSVSHALALARGSDIAWMEVCSVAGTKLVKADISGKKADAPATHAASFALPPSASPAFRLAESNRMRPLLFYQSPQPLPIWTDAQTRAPPGFS